MVNKRYKEAVANCSAALDAMPDYFKALVRRSKAYEAQAQYKQALADLQRANKLDSATDDSRSAERRVKDLASGKTANGAARKASTALGGPAGMGRQVAIPIKLSLGDDTRSFQVSPSISYSELLEHAKALFPNAGPFMLKFLDKEGDLVTIGSRQDLQRAMNESAEQVDRKRIVQGGGLPPIRMQAIKVASADAVPKAPEEEKQAMQQMLQQLQKIQQMQTAKGGNPQAAAAAAAAAQQQQQQMQQQPLIVDEWIMAFVDLLKEHCGLDPDRPVELQEVGNDRLQAAFQAMIADDPKADELFDEAEERFREMAAAGIACQGQVYSTKAELVMQKAAEGKGALLSDAEALLAKAEGKVVEAIAYCPAAVDSYMMRSTIEQTRAKIAANYILIPPQPRDDITDLAERQAVEDVASKEAVLKALEKVSIDGLAAADKHMELAYEYLQSGIDAMPEKEKTKELKPLKPMAEQMASGSDEATPMKATMLINLGNAHYEHSLLRAAAGQDWRSLVQKAQSLFRDAGAAEVDIRQALKGHPKAAEMEDIIGPDPKPVDAVAPVAAAAVAAEEAPKGLPALKPRKKKDTA